jgi:hypothetical protein
VRKIERNTKDHEGKRKIAEIEKEKRETRKMGRKDEEIK